MATYCASAHRPLEAVQSPLQHGEAPHLTIHGRVAEFTENCAKTREQQHTSYRCSSNSCGSCALTTEYPESCGCIGHEGSYLLLLHADLGLFNSLRPAVRSSDADAEHHLGAKCSVAQTRD